MLHFHYLCLIDTCNDKSAFLCFCRLLPYDFSKIFPILFSFNINMLNIVKCPKKEVNKVCKIPFYVQGHHFILFASWGMATCLPCKKLFALPKVEKALKENENYRGFEAIL